MIGGVLGAVLFVAGLALLFLLSGAETAAIAANRRRFREAEAAGDRAAAEVMDLLGDLRRILAATLAGKALAVVAAALGLRAALEAAGPQWRHWGGGPLSTADLLTFAATPILFLAISEFTARGFFRQQADRVIRFLALPLKALAAGLTPLVEALQGAVRLALRPFGGAAAGRPYSREDLAALFSAGRVEALVRGAASEDAVLDTAGRSMIHNIVDLERTRVREIMRPLIDVVAIRLGETGIEGLKDLTRRTGYSRFPVYRSRILELEGCVSVFDVLKNSDPSKQRLEDFVREPYYAPEVMRVNELLREFLDRRLTEAIVVDEYGACSGWITREDLLEEIVGDIEDEFDRPPPKRIHLEPSGAYLCDAQIDIDDLSEALQVRLPKEGFETLGGWIYDTLGKVPAVGDSAPFGDLTVEVVEMKGPTIKKARIRPSSAKE